MIRGTTGVRRAIVGAALAAVVAAPTASTRADDLGPAIDLSTFGEEAPAAASVWDETPLAAVTARSGPAPRRAYVSGMIGPSFANLGGPVVTLLDGSDTLFNAGGALGVAFERAHGRLRLEAEGMGRGTYEAPFDVLPIPGVATVLSSNWSALGNIWRDVMFTERFGAYGGGGVGAGGYILGISTPFDTLYLDPASGFAWQAGGGLLYELGDRLTFDVGYRFFQIDALRQGPMVVPTQFSASELLFTLRLYEPFRGWRQ